MAASETGAHARGIAYRCAPDVRWVVQLRGILIVNDGTGATCMLGGPRAAMWDLIQRYPFHTAVRMLGAIAGLDLGEAERQLRGSLADWESAGFLIREDARG